MKRISALSPVLLFAVLIALGGCRPEEQEPPPPPIIDSTRIVVTAFIMPDSAPEQVTIDLLERFQAEHPERVEVRIFDITDGARGTAQWREAGLDSVAIAINGNVTVGWGDGDARRTVSFLHPPGFAWNHDDLRQALDAALRGELCPAEPEEAEGVRLICASIRGQAIRIGNRSEETGQLIINDQPVISVTEPRGDLAPGQRVTIAASALEEVLERSLTPSQLSTEQTPDGVALLAAENVLLVATEEDARAEGTEPQALAQTWLRDLRRALIAAVQPCEASRDGSSDSNDSDGGRHNGGRM